MRIAYWLPAFLPDVGGMEVLAAESVPVFQKMGHEMMIIAAYGSYADLPAVTEEVRDALEGARRGEGPALLELFDPSEDPASASQITARLARSLGQDPKHLRDRSREVVLAALAHAEATPPPLPGERSMGVTADLASPGRWTRRGQSSDGGPSSGPGPQEDQP